MKPVNGPQANAMWWGATTRSVLHCLGAIALAAVLATVVDPHLGLGSPLDAQIVNAALPVGIMLVVGVVFGRVWVAIGIEVLILLVLRYADGLKTGFLDTNLVYADLKVIPSLIENPHLVMGFVRLSWLAFMAMALCGAIAVALLYFLRRRGRMPPRLRIAFLIAAVTLAAGLSIYHPDGIEPTLQWSVYGQPSGASHVGITGNILLGEKTAADVNRAADPAAVAAFWREPAVKKAVDDLRANAILTRPDIVVVQSESLFLPSQLCGLSDSPWLKNIGGSDVSHLQVPVFGGRTLQTEFEVQTGAPIAFFPGSMFAYYEQLGQPVDAVAYALDQLGYRTTFLHPNSRGFWRRNTAIPNMGFDTFQDIGSFLPEDFSGRGHISDMALMRSVLAELDGANRPAYVTAITMDNHGPWGEFAPTTAKPSLPSALTEEARKELADYLTRAKDADDAFGFLTDALSRRARPTIVAIYGDHLPALEPVYQRLCFKDGKTPPEHDPPLRVWANFPIPAPPSRVPAYLLNGWLAKAAHLAISGPLLADAAAASVAADNSMPIAERARILDEYANVAAANLQTPATFDGAQAQVFVGSSGALTALGNYHARASTATKTMGDDLLLADDVDAGGMATFNLNQHLRSLSLRPHVRCLAGAPGEVGRFSVTADGHEIYDASMSPQALRLITLDLRGVKTITLRANLAGFPGECIALVHVAQLEECTAHCALVRDLTPPRVMRHDFMAGDIAALSRYGGATQATSVSMPMANLEWLLARRKAHQDGAVPIKLQGDAQLFMHPADVRDAWVEFDTSGIESIDMTPRINALDASCRGLGKEAGVVGLSLLVDGKPVISNLRVDRFYNESLHVPLTSSRTLRIDVSDGNGVTTCDWFSIGVAHIALPGETVHAP